MSVYFAKFRHFVRIGVYNYETGSNLSTQVHAVAAAALRARLPQCRSRACPGNTANSIPRRIRRDPGNRRQRLGATVPSYNFPGSNPSQQVPSAVAISAQSAVRRLPRSAQHIPSPSPLAQAFVRSLLTMQKERTRKLHVHMGVAASTTARITSSSR